MYVCINTPASPSTTPRAQGPRARDEQGFVQRRALQGARQGFLDADSVAQPYFKKTWEYKRDIAKAKQLLAQAGIPNGFTIKIMALKGSEEIMGEVPAGQPRRHRRQGDVDVNGIPVALEAIFNKQDFRLRVLGDVISPDPDLFLSTYMFRKDRRRAPPGQMEQRNGA